MTAARVPLTRQMVLDLTRAPSFDADDFLVSPSNAEAHDTILRWPRWPARTLLLVGPAGSGKSHLAAIWAEHSGASSLDREALDHLTCVGPVIGVVEDGDRVVYPETALFHLLNLVEETGGWLILTARAAPDRWGVQTPDLLSRLRRAPVVTIGAPDPELLRSVIVKLFADRQIRIDSDIVGYAALHCDQSLDAVAKFVSAVDEASLAEGRRITRPLAAKTLAAIQTDRGYEKSALGSSADCR